MHVVPLKTEWLELSEDFARRTVDSRMSKLKSRGQSNITKISRDITAGAVAEFAVREFLLSLPQYTAVSTPDLNLYIGNRKSFSADLIAVGQDGLLDTAHNVHVKTYSNPKWASWVFTYNPERGDVDPLINCPTEQDYICLTHTRLLDMIVEIHYFVRAGAVINSYRPPILPQLQFSKLVLYPEDVHRVCKVLGEKSVD